MPACSIGLPGTVDPRLGEELAFSNSPKQGSDQKRKMFPTD